MVWIFVRWTVKSVPSGRYFTNAHLGSIGGIGGSQNKAQGSLIGPSGNAIDFVFLKSRVDIQLEDIHPTHSFILIRLSWTVFGSAVSGKKVTDG